MSTAMRKVRALLILAPLLSVGQAQAVPLRISYPAISPSSTGTWMAHETGAFKKYGLDVQLIYISSSGTNVQALLGGSLDIATAGSTGIVIAAARGAPLVIIAAAMNRAPVTLYVQPEITKIEELRGKSLAISSFGSAGHGITTLVLRKFGLEKDVTLRPVGGVPQRQAAFEQKVVAGFMTLVRPKVPARALLNAADLDIPYGYSLFFVSRDYLLDHSDIVMRFLRGYIEGLAMMVHEKEKAIKILAKYLNRTDRPFLEEMYNLAKDHIDRVPRVDPRCISTALEFSNIKGVNSETLSAQLIDNSFVDKLVKEKFIEKVFGKEVR